MIELQLDMVTKYVNKYGMSWSTLHKAYWSSCPLWCRVSKTKYLGKLAFKWKYLPHYKASKTITFLALVLFVNCSNDAILASI